MKPLSFKRHRYPAGVIRQALWLDFRFTLSLRDIEGLLARRGIEVSSETLRCRIIRLGPRIARRLQTRRPALSPFWNLDQGGLQHWWPADVPLAGGR
ncbi:MAG: hypothetical protein ACK5QD_03795 [Brevundimonas sp.]|uniref:hypothetical protein n=1 Tax=Brevundimonas sp. TaxID=1871086 RepID=UPI0022BBF3DD|nr:hypothetical protein [Brevundimonas sp.]MCZ8193843.1 hypothetical protein [Brevundimonas sp.]